MAVPEAPLPASSGAELPDAEVLRWLYRRMVLIRRFEERIDALRLALKYGLSARTCVTRQVGSSFFGDDAMGQVLVYECINMAAIWKLPMIFVCENNGYAESTPAEYALGSKDLAQRAEPFGL